MIKWVSLLKRSTTSSIIISGLQEKYFFFLVSRTVGYMKLAESEIYHFVTVYCFLCPIFHTGFSTIYLILKVAC